MAKLDILIYPDRRLRRVAQPVTNFNAELKKLVADMAETMYAAPGIGLAAVQVNVLKRVVVMDVSETHDDLLVFINPEVSEPEGEAEFEEGCLSVPGVYAMIERPARVKIRANNVSGEPFEMLGDGMLSVCIQHEIDHLNGKMFVDYLSRLKQDRVRKKIKKNLSLDTPQAA